MEQLVVDDHRLDYQVRGDGEPLLAIHGAILADVFECIAPALTQRYNFITYRRRGFGSSSPADPSTTISAQAADALALLDHLDIPRAHVAGHSYGGAVTLQLALDAPDRVHTLGLLEPGLLAAPSGAEFGAGVATIAELFQRGESDAALVGFLTAVGGADPETRLNKTMASDWYNQALADLPTLLSADHPSLGAWEFGGADAARITQPALAALGTETFPLCAESYELLARWLPNAEPFVLNGATHLLQLDDPDAMAAGLLAFLERHPLNG